MLHNQNALKIRFLAIYISLVMSYNNNENDNE